MAYCVNCGVELAASEKKCPLCGVKVILPKEIEETEPAKGLYPHSLPPIRIELREILPIFAVLLLIPLLICVICDFLTSRTISWSMYVAASIILAYVYLFTPFLFKKNRAVIYISLCTAATALFLLFLSFKTNGVWFMPLALPIALTAGILLLTLSVIFDRFRPRKLVKAAFVLFAAALFVSAVNIFVNLFICDPLIISWSFYCSVPCAIIGIILLMLNRSSRIKAEAKRRFFI
ncbi:MAG: hypothetical protein IJO48_05610 [Clostridia bacterium]|nr:hypothetical protein [Clostridia bacterium]